MRREGLEALRGKLAEVLADSMVRVQVMIPFSRGEMVELFHRRGRVEQEKHEDEGTFIAGRIPHTLRGYYTSYEQVSNR